MCKTYNKIFCIILALGISACNGGKRVTLPSKPTPSPTPTVIPMPKFAYVFNDSRTPSVNSYSVSSSGILSFVKSKVVLGPYFATSYDGTIALGGDDIGGVAIYKLNNGVVNSSESSVTLGAKLTALALSTDGRHGIATTYSKFLYSIGVDNSANLTIESQITDLPNYTNALAISSSGRFVVTGDDSGNVISYSLDSNGNLSKISELKIANNTFINSLAISADETKVVTTYNQNASLFGLNNKGELTPESNVPIDFFKSTNVAISGGFCYVTEAVGQDTGFNVSTYTITNDTLNFVESSSLSGAPLAIAISQDGNYGYITDLDNKRVNEFSITSGKFTPLSESSIATGINPQTISLTY